MFFGKQENCFWKTLIKYPEYVETFANFEKHKVLQQEIFKELESLVCKLYGLKNSSLVDEVRKCLNPSPYAQAKE